MQQSSQQEHSQATRPNVFAYTNFRVFLKDSYDCLSAKNPAFSESAFIRKAGYGANSRGYLGLILKGKRNLSNKAIIGFSTALKLSEKETDYFSNLVLFNQAKSEQDKDFYFAKMEKSIKGRESKAYMILKSQYNYYKNWYVVAIRELVSLDNFVEDYSLISSLLRGKVSKSQVKESIQDLLNLGLLNRDEAGKLYQAETLTKFVDNSINFKTVTNFHKELLNKSKESLDEDEYEDRSASCVMLTCKKSDFEEIREEIKEFRAKILNKYGNQHEGLDSLVSLNLQLIKLTDPKKNMRYLQ